MCEGGRERRGCISFFLSFFLACTPERTTKHSIQSSANSLQTLEWTIRHDNPNAFHSNTRKQGSKEGRTLKHGTIYIYMHAIHFSLVKN
jgi:hypothetical protein